MGTKLRALSLFAAAAILCAVPAHAATFAIDPTRLVFSTMTSGDIVVSNISTQPVRLSVRAYDWTQDTRNAEIRNVTEAVAFFPQIFTVAPGSAQRVRVGALGAPAATEHAYRLIVSELPPMQREPIAGSGLQILTRVDLPVFISATNTANAHVALAGVQRLNDGVSVTLANNGNTHAEQSEMRVEGLDASGRHLWDGNAHAFYVLAGSRIGVRINAPPHLMSATRSVRVSWDRQQWSERL